MSRDIRRFHRQRLIKKRKRQMRYNGTDVEEWPYFHGGSIYDKRSLGCNCRKKKKGQPKVWDGMCKCDYRYKRRKIKVVSDG